MARSRKQVEQDIVQNRNEFAAAAKAVMADPRLAKLARKQDIEAGHQVATERHRALMVEHQESLGDERAELWSKAFNPNHGLSSTSAERHSLYLNALDRGLAADKQQLATLMEVTTMMGDTVSSSALALCAHKAGDMKSLGIYAKKYGAGPINELNAFDSAQNDQAAKLTDRIRNTGPGLPQGYDAARAGEQA